MANMRIYFFSDAGWEQRLQTKANQLIELFHLLAADTPTSDLVLAVYFLRHSTWSGGVAFAHDWLTPAKFVSQRGRWNFTQRFILPSDLAPRFKLIRLQFGLKNSSYPMCQTDTYGWKLRYQTFSDHIAFLFAHELHHYRRFHLGWHPREGEQSANQWAREQVQRLGFQVTAERLPAANRKQRLLHSLVTRLRPDPFANFRHLGVGAMVLISHDPRGRYQGELVAIKRPIRRNARRAVVETGDGRQWRWPLEWLKAIG